MALEHLQEILKVFNNKLKGHCPEINNALAKLEEFKQKPAKGRKKRLLHALSNAIREVRGMQEGNKGHFKDEGLDDLVDGLVKQSEELEHIEEKIIEVAKQKSSELENNDKIFFRFMNFREFEEVFTSGILPRKEAIGFEKTFEEIQTEHWYYFMNITDWPDSTQNPATYSILEGEYVSLIREGKRLKKKGDIPNAKKFALTKFRKELLFYIYAGGKSFLRTRAKFKDLTDEQLEDYCRRGLKREGPFNEHDKIAKSIVNDKEYLIRNSKDIKKIIFTMISDEPSLGSSKGYDLIFFIKPKYFTWQDIKNRKYKTDYWGETVESNIRDSALAILVMVPSRRLVNDVKEIVYNSSLKDSNMAIPVYNTKGRLHWPK